MLMLLANRTRLATFGPLAVVVAVYALVQLRSPRVPNIADSIPAGESAELGPVGDFTFFTAEATAVRSSDLRGKVLVLGCFFTCCTESCPQISASLARLQRELADEPNVRLISLTVDPTNDTPQRLDQYARTYQALAERWLFLRGSEAEVHSFVRNRLKLGVVANTNAVNEPGNRMLHSPKLTLIDAKGNIRGFFDGTDTAAVDRLRTAVQKLAREN